MTSPSCYASILFCEILTARLNPDGTIAFGSEAVYVSDAGIQLGMNPTVSAAQGFEQRNGCGTRCVIFDSDCDVVSGYTLAMQLCTEDVQLDEMLLGGTLEEISDGGSGQVAVGYQDPDPTAPCYNGVLFEGYSKAWDGDEQASHPVSGEPAWWRYRFPKVLWRPDNETLQNGVNVHNVTGRAVPNSAAGTGPFCDWPAAVSGARARDLISESQLPSQVLGVSCGPQELVSCGS